MFALLLVLAPAILGETGASATSTAADPLAPIVSYLLGFGTLGIVFVLALMDRIDLHPAAARKREAELKAEIQNYQEVFTKEVNPTLQAVVEAVKLQTQQLSSDDHQLDRIFDLIGQVNTQLTILNGKGTT